MASQGSTNTIDQLLGESDTSPNNPLSSDEIARIRISANIVRQNFNSLEEFIDGDIDQDGLFITFEPERDESIAYLYGHIHNYLSSLYSVNEQIREKVNENVSSDKALSKYDFRKGTSPYTEKLAFIHGLRHDIQHGEFNSIKIEEMNSIGRFRVDCIKFNEDKFQNTVRKGHDYLRHTNTQQREYPIPYISDFHKNQFNVFIEDCVEWMKR